MPFVNPGGRAFRKRIAFGIDLFQASRHGESGTDQGGGDVKPWYTDSPKPSLFGFSAYHTAVPVFTSTRSQSQDSEPCSFWNRRLPRTFFPGAEPTHGNHLPCDVTLPRHGVGNTALLKGSLVGSLCIIVETMPRHQTGRHTLGKRTGRPGQYRSWQLGTYPSTDEASLSGGD